MILESDGVGSLLDVSALTSFQGHSGQEFASKLQVTNGGTLLDPNHTSFVQVNLTADSTATFTLPSNQSIIGASGVTTNIIAGPLAILGEVIAPDNATIALTGTINVNGLGILSSSSAGTIKVGGNLLGTTQNTSQWNLGGTLLLSSATGTSNPPQLVEAMSADLGAIQAGFENNFAFGTLSLASNTYAKLVDQSHNSTGTGAEAVYANELIVPGGATLDLNGLHVYVRGAQIAGAISAASVIQIPCRRRDRDWNAHAAPPSIRPARSQTGRFSAVRDNPSRCS